MRINIMSTKKKRIKAWIEHVSLHRKGEEKI
jgi:hypothetical protein